MKDHSLIPSGPSARIRELEAALAKAEQRSADYPVISARLHDREKAREAEQKACTDAIARANRLEAALAKADATIAELQGAFRAKITGEMVARAHAEYHKVLGDPLRSDPMRAALEAACICESCIDVALHWKGRAVEALAALKPFADDAETYDPPEDDDLSIAWNTDFQIGALHRARTVAQSIEKELKS